jgi:hypothetical protein
MNSLYFHRFFSLGNDNSAKIEICQKRFRGHIKNAFYDVPSKAFAEQLKLRLLKHCPELVMAALWQWNESVKCESFLPIAHEVNVRIWRALGVGRFL